MIPRRPDTLSRLSLSPEQQRVWFLHEWQPGTVLGNVTIGLRLRGELDVGALNEALGLVAARHEPLRTTFRSDGGLPYAVVGPPPDPRCQLGALPPVADGPGGRDAAALAALAQAAAAPLDATAAAGPFRLRLDRLDRADQVLALTLHALCGDRRSAELVLADLGAAYSAVREGRPAALPPPRLRYGDIAVWQRERLRGGELEPDLRHWQAALSGLPVQELPIDRPRPSGPAQRTATVESPVDDEVAAWLRGIAAERGVPLLAVLLAGLAAVLARYGRHDEAVLGTRLPGRDGPELAGVVGPLANTVPLRVAVAGDPSFDTLLDRVAAALGEARRHDVPFAAVVDRLQPERDPSRHPLVQIAMELVQPAEPARFAGLRTSLVDDLAEHSQLDIALSALDGPSGLRLRARYAEELFAPARVTALLAHLARALAAGHVPATPASKLPLLTVADRVLAASGRAGPPCRARRGPMHLLVSEQASRTPAATAVVAGDQLLDYAALERRSGRLAAQLRARGIGRADRVGIFLPRDANLVVTLLAVLRTGAAFVPLDLSYPPGRLAVIAEDAALAAVVTGQPLLGQLPGGLAAGALCLIRDLDPADDGGPGGGLGGDGPGSGDDGSGDDAHPDDLCHIVFTSGSTGRPKGVAATHANVTGYVDALLATVPPERFRRVPLATAMSFDAYLNELWPPLLTGGTVAVVDNLIVASAAELAGATLVNSVPSVLTEFLRVQRLPATVEAITIGAEPLPPTLVEEVFRSSGVTEIWNMYGPTESTGYATAVRLGRDGDRRISIGGPLPNVRPYVLDRYGEPAPVGVAGELSVGGPGVTRGYFGRPDLTAERFPADPFAGPGSRLYRTGDLVRWRDDGALDFLGRIDTQVKIRGYRIELGEVEAALAAHPAVAAAVVAVRRDQSGEPRLVGYVVPAAARPPTPAELTAAARAMLPGYMVPAAVVLVEALPLSPNGKVDRSALPAPAWAGGAGRAAAPPSTPVERSIAQVWSYLLHRDRISVSDDFFDLGGRSMLALRVLAELRRRFGVRLPVRRLFEAPTLAGLATAVEDAMVREAEPDELARLLDEVSGVGEVSGTGGLVQPAGGIGEAGGG